MAIIAIEHKNLLNYFPIPILSLIFMQIKFTCNWILLMRFKDFVSLEKKWRNFLPQFQSLSPLIHCSFAIFSHFSFFHSFCMCVSRCALFFSLSMKKLLFLFFPLLLHYSKILLFDPFVSRFYLYSIFFSCHLQNKFPKTMRNVSDWKERMWRKKHWKNLRGIDWWK